jgi:hypothetical protein
MAALALATERVPRIHGQCRRRRRNNVRSIRVDWGISGATLSSRTKKRGSRGLLSRAVVAAKNAGRRVGAVSAVFEDEAAVRSLGVIKIGDTEGGPAESACIASAGARKALLAFAALSDRVLPRNRSSSIVWLHLYGTTVSMPGSCTVICSSVPNV